MRSKLTHPGLLTVVVLLATCSPAAAPTFPPAMSGQAIPLPQARRDGSTSLEQALARRRSVRQFEGLPLTAGELGQLLWAAQGITDERGFRTAPSAGGLYPLEVYVTSADGTFHYEPREHRLVLQNPGDARRALYEAALRQEPVRQAPAVFVVAAVYARTAAKYGEERGSRYVHLEAGHAAQNLLLEAVALDLGAVPIGAFHDDQVQNALGLPVDHEPLYLIPVGHPQAARE